MEEQQKNIKLPDKEDKEEVVKLAEELKKQNQAINEEAVEKEKQAIAEGRAPATLVYDPKSDPNHAIPKARDFFTRTPLSVLKTLVEEMQKAEIFSQEEMKLFEGFSATKDYEYITQQEEKKSKKKRSFTFYRQLEWLERFIRMKLNHAFNIYGMALQAKRGEDAWRSLRREMGK